jgi:ketosteroid isomerase-like protein
LRKTRNAFALFTKLPSQAIERRIAAGDTVVALGRIQGKTRKAAVPVDVPFAHVWTVREGYLQRLRAFTDTAVLAHALSKH